MKIIAFNPKGFLFIEYNGWLRTQQVVSNEITMCDLYFSLPKFEDANECAKHFDLKY